MDSSMNFKRYLYLVKTMFVIFTNKRVKISLGYHGQFPFIVHGNVNEFNAYALQNIN